MKAIVDKETCTGCGLCADTCPQVFEIDGVLASVKIEEVPPEDEEACREAAECCPVEAIEIED